MGSVVLRRTILVILSTCYTNGLLLSDLYPYGTEYGDSMSIGSGLYRPTPLLAPIDNLVILSPAGLTATSYRIYRDGSLVLENGANWISLSLLRILTGHFLNTKIYGRITTDQVLVKRAMDQINEEFPNTFCSTSPPTQLIIATWIDYLKFGSNSGSNFQLIVVSGRCNTFGIAFLCKCEHYIS
ncbi:PREDICTED: uncharacterized protein LOC109586010 [Amphimedon queenslandica]|uniref:NIDO domain-containing protein n=1 Tax=Amphimedon queenslandica TaxID=400682 RepID=A0AAN0JL47_AMPQE|nr:PREDICTED: uncharacterized protein LOC109586010 [Amphimedon queenslandica]|eukprot:XP_019857733.1 PREDICTED: uncharacterized protein LOC109586010 [Amphimedon queenslandica]